jgi:hypothetical protein
MEFDATLDLDGKTATGITVPAEIVTTLDAGKRPSVQVTINGHSFSTTIGSVKGVFKIPVSAERRELIHAAAGDSLRVSVVLAAAPGQVAVPQDLADALASDPGTEEFFAGLTPSQKKGFIAPIEDAKTADTRARRVEKAAAALTARQKRP